MTRALRSALSKRWPVAAAATVLAAGVWFALPVLPQDADIVSAELIDRDGQVLHVAATADGFMRLRADLDAIDPAFVRALLAMEDRRFHAHPGVDPLAMVRALRSNRSAGRVVSGASTITQQLGRQYRPRPRTYRSKAVEALEALRLDARMGKREQLERYLGRISYGGNVQGVEAAARVWLGKSARYLSADEIALLLALPQAPEARRPDRNPVAAKAGRDRIIDRMVASGLLDAADGAQAKRRPVPTRRHSLPSGNALALQSLGPGGSFLDGALQERVRRVLRGYVKEQPIPVNAAALVVHAPSREVRALVGTGARDHAGGWIDMTDRVRSPGSTLKPFVYALARDDGLLDMGSEVRDAPTRFGHYRPENFTRRYHGRVTVEEALQHSLNVPAVTVLDQVGADRFRAALNASGPTVRGRRGEGRGEGLAVALGGTGLTARDLAVLYTALANGGQVAPLRFRPGDTQGASYPLTSKTTANALLDALRGAPRPKGFANLPDIGRVAYKTGTSYGHRDSWAAGVAGDYVVVVWTGRPDGAPRPGRTGRDAAAPLLFDIAAPLVISRRHAREVMAPAALQRVEAPTDEGPVIVFPAHGSEVLHSARGLSVSVDSDSAVRLYADGAPVPRRAGQRVWRPDAPGFYSLTAVDARGRSANADIRVVSRDQAIDAPF